MPPPKKETARLFIGIPIPPPAAGVLRSALPRFEAVITRQVPRENWHITLLFLGNVRDFAKRAAAFTRPVSLPFVPTITLTHVGPGTLSDQLWAYAQLTPALTSLRSEIMDYARDVQLLPMLREDTQPFVPHSKLAHIADKQLRFGIGDVATPITFPVREVVLYQSVPLPGSMRYQILQRVAIIE